MAKLSLDLPIKRDNWNCRQRTLQNAPREPYKLELLLSRSQASSRAKFSPVLQRLYNIYESGI